VAFWVKVVDELIECDQTTVLKCMHYPNGHWIGVSRINQCQAEI
jgi:hypothetical protein